MNVNLRISCSDVPQKIDIPRKWQFRVMPALHQDLNAADGGKFIQFLIDLLETEHVMIFVALRPIKRAEFAVNIANVRVIDVAIDNVGHDFVSLAVVRQALRLPSSFVCQRAKLFERQLIKLNGFAWRDSFPRQHSFYQRISIQRNHRAAFYLTLLCVHAIIRKSVLRCFSEFWPRSSDSCLMENRRSTLISLAGLLGLTLAMFGDVLFAGGTRLLGSQATDLSLQFLSWRDFGFRELAKGNLALWNPHIYGGAPYFGSMQSALLYPPNWIFLILPLSVAVNWSIALHVFFMGAFMFFWMKQRGLQAAPSFFAGALAMFSGAFFLHIFAGHLPHLNTMTWSPLIFCAIDSLLSGRMFRWCLLGMFAVAMQALAGFPQYLFYTAIIAGLYSALRLVQPWNWRITASLLSIYPGGALLAAAQLFPAIQATRETVRGVPLPFEFASMFAFPPENFLTLIAPNFFGEISRYWGRCYLWEMSIFVGIIGIALAIYATVYCEGKTKWIPLSALVVSLLFALGVHTPLFGFLYACVPGFDKFRSVSKFILPASLFLVLLAATGLDRLFKQKKIEPSFVIALFAFAALLGIGGLWAIKTSSWPALIKTTQATGETYLPPQLYASGEFIAQSQGRAAMSIFLAAGTCALLGGLLILLKNDHRALYGVIALAVVEMFVFARTSLATFNSATVANAEEKSFFDAHPDDYRILNLFNPNSAMSLGVHDMWGYDASVVRRYAEFIAWTQDVNPDKATQYVKFTRFDPLYAMLRLRYLFALRENKFQVAEAPAPPLPPVQLVSNYRLLQDRDAIFDTLHSAAFDPTREVILESEPEPKPLPSENAGTARIVATSTDALTIEADVVQPSILLITDTFTASWRAIALPGSAQANYQLLPANYVLRAVPLAAGHHRLRVEYASQAFEIGKWISIFTVLAFLAALTWCGRHKPF